MFGYLDTYNMALRAMADKIKELEAENARLRQQRDSANAQLDFILENMKCDTPRKAIEHTKSYITL